MKAKTLQVVWHSGLPVFGIDMNRSGLVVTGGGDKDVKVKKKEKSFFLKAAIDCINQNVDARQMAIAPRFLPLAVLSCSLI